MCILGSSRSWRDGYPLFGAAKMTELNDERWAFMVEWFDSSADLVRQYQLLYYLMDSTLEMSVPACSVRARCCSPRAPPP